MANVYSVSVHTGDPGSAPGIIWPAEPGFRHIVTNVQAFFQGGGSEPLTGWVNLGLQDLFLGPLFFNLQSVGGGVPAEMEPWVGRWVIPDGFDVWCWRASTGFHYDVAVSGYRLTLP